MQLYHLGIQFHLVIFQSNIIFFNFIKREKKSNQIRGFYSTGWLQNCLTILTCILWHIIVQLRWLRSSQHLDNTENLCFSSVVVPNLDFLAGNALLFLLINTKFWNCHLFTTHVAKMSFPLERLCKWAPLICSVCALHVCSPTVHHNDYNETGKPAVTGRPV